MNDDIARLERALTHSGNRRLRTLVLEGVRATELTWPDDLLPLRPEVRTWLTWRELSDPQWLRVPSRDAEVLCQLLTPLQAAELMHRQENASRDRPRLIPILGDAGNSCARFLCDGADGSVWEQEYDDEGMPLFLRVANSVFELLGRIAEFYQALRRSHWRRLRVEKCDDPKWASVPRYDAAFLETCARGTVLASSFRLAGRRASWLFIKLDDEQWLETGLYGWDGSANDLLNLERGLDGFRAQFAEGNVEKIRSSVHLAKSLSTLVRKWGTQPWTLLAGATRVWQQPTMDALLLRFAAVLKSKFPQIVLRPGLSSAALVALERAAGRRSVPEDLKALYAFADGQDKGNLYWKYRFIPTGEIPEQSALQRRLRDERFGPQYWDDGLIPCFEDGAGDLLCVDCEGAYGPAGSVVHIDHEQPHVREVRYDSVTQWLECFVDGLEGDLFSWPDGGMFPADSQDDFIAAHDRARTNDEYPWRTHLRLRCP
jgi:cell wall assembly regulator SMI1